MKQIIAVNQFVYPMKFYLLTFSDMDVHLA